jgi:hypothetical protein
MLNCALGARARAKRLEGRNGGVQTRALLGSVDVRGLTFCNLDTNVAATDIDTV